ncbi:helix-turn-helix domain-containing protein [Planctomycetota bacterium]
MRPPAQIKDWLSIEKMFQWLQSAPDEKSYKRRLCIWLTHTGKLHANKVADILNVSTQAVWLWIGQYNRYGPSGLKRKGRGGRRWAFLTLEQEAELLKPFVKDAKKGKLAQHLMIKDVIEQKLGSKVSSAYVYRLLNRHNFNTIYAQSGNSKKTKENFEKLSRPWLRNI